MRIALSCFIVALAAFYSSKFSSAQRETVTVEWGDWSVWSQCSVSCGGGLKIRERRCITPGVRPKRCLRTRRRRCETKRCPDSDTAPTMMQITSMPEPKEDTTKAMPGTKEAPVGMNETESMLGVLDIKTTPEGMPGTKPAPMEMPDTTMPVPEGMFGTRETQMEIRTTKPTAEVMIDTTPMPKQLTEWGEWSDCEAACGGGMRYRTRQCLDEYWESECEFVDGQECNTQPCEGPTGIGEPPPVETIDKDISPTPEWMPDTRPTPDLTPDLKGISPTPERMPDTRPAPEMTPALRGISPTPERMPDTRPDPEMTPDLNDTATTKYAVTATVTTVAPEPKPESPDGDIYTSWSTWTPCSVTCGVGRRYRVRECLKLNGHEDCEESEDEQCNTERCSDVQSQRKKTNEEMKQICGKSRIKASRNNFQTAFSPGFPSKYPNGLDCMWTIVAPPNSRVKLVIDSFQASECCDKLTLLEGRPRENPYIKARIVTLTGHVRSGAEYTSIGRYMTVRLQTNLDSSGGIYNFRYKGIADKVDEKEVRSKEEKTPEEEIWWKIMRLLVAWVYKDTH